MWRTKSRPRIRERLPLLRHKLPRITPRNQRQLQHAIRIRIPHFAVRDRKSKRIMASPARPHHKFPNPIHRIGMPIWILRREPLVRVLMPRQKQRRVRRVQIAPHISQLWMHRVARKNPAAEQWMVPIRNHAPIRMRGQILPQPLFLRRSLRAPAEIRRRAVRIQRYDVPGTQIVAVVAPRVWPRPRSPILKIGGRLLIHRIFVIPRRRPRPVFESSPRRVVAILKIRRATPLIRQIAEREHRTRYLLDQLRRGTGSLNVLAARNVAGAYQYIGFARRNLRSKRCGNRRLVGSRWRRPRASTPNDNHPGQK